MPKVQVEHIIQRYLKKWVRDYVDCPHMFLSFDSAQKATENARARAASRGILSGTPDTLLITGRGSIWCELKAPGNEPTDLQSAVGAKLMALGHSWSWVSSVVVYCEWLAALGVPLRPSAQVGALDADLRAKAAIDKKRGAAPKSYRSKKEPRFLASKRKARSWNADGIL